MTAADWPWPVDPSRWYVRYPSGTMLPVNSEAQAKRIARNVGGTAVPPPEPRGPDD